MGREFGHTHTQVKRPNITTFLVLILYLPKHNCEAVKCNGYFVSQKERGNFHLIYKRSYLKKPEMDQKMVERNISTLFAYILHLSFYAKIQTMRVNRK